MKPIPRVTPSTKKIDHRWWNGIVEHLEYLMRLKGSGPLEVNMGSAGPVISLKKAIPPWTDTVKVHNLTGDDRERGDVVQLGGYLLSPVDLHVLLFEGNTPADPVTARFAILHQGLDEDQTGLAHVSGACVAKVNVTDATHTHATPEAGEYVLQSAGSGPVELLSLPNGTGEQELVVLLRVSAVDSSDDPSIPSPANPCIGSCKLEGNGSGGWDVVEDGCTDTENAYHECRCEIPPVKSEGEECTTTGCKPIHVDDCADTFTCGGCSDFGQEPTPDFVICLTVPPGTFAGESCATEDKEGVFPLVSVPFIYGLNLACSLSYFHPPGAHASELVSVWRAIFLERGGNTILQATYFRRDTTGQNFFEWYEIGVWEADLGASPVACLANQEVEFELVRSLTIEDVNAVSWRCNIAEGSTLTAEISPAEECARVAPQNASAQGACEYTWNGTIWEQTGDCLNAPGGDEVEGAECGDPPTVDGTEVGQAVNRTCVAPSTVEDEGGCCEEALPLYVAFTFDSGGAAGCPDGIQINLTYDTDAYYGEALTACAGTPTIYMRMVCDATQWKIQWTCDPTPDWGTVDAYSATFACDPFTGELNLSVFGGEAIVDTCGVASTTALETSFEPGEGGGPPPAGGCTAWQCAWISNGTSWSRVDDQFMVCPPAGSCACGQPNIAGINGQLEFSNCISLA